MKSKIILILILTIILVPIIYIYKDNKTELNIKGNNPSGIKLDDKDNIEKISYSYSGTYIGAIYTYEIYKEDDKTKLKIKYMNINDENPDIIIINNDILDKIMILIKKYKVYNWHGYKKYATDILDGSSFSLNINLNSKKSIDIFGYNCAPNGYYNFEKELLSLIEDDINKVKEKYKL